MLKLNEKNRNHTIDAFRVFAIFGVVAIHVKSSTVEAVLIGDFFSPIAVPFFYIVSLLYFIIGLKKGGNDIFNSTVKKTFYRLILPYLIWTLIYVSLRIYKSHLAGVTSEIVFWRAFFYGESAVQLYFIPYLLSMQTILLSLYLLLRGNLKNKLYGAIFLIITFLYLEYGIENKCFGNSLGFSLIGIPLFIILAFLSSFFLSNEKNSKTVIVGATIILVTSIVLKSNIPIDFFGYPSTTPLMAFGILLLGIGLYDLIRIPIVITSATYGIYLSHVLFLEAFEFVINKKQIFLNYGFFEKLVVTSFLFGI